MRFNDAIRRTGKYLGLTGLCLSSVQLSCEPIEIQYPNFGIGDIQRQIRDLFDFSEPDLYDLATSEPVTDMFFESLKNESQKPLK